MKNQKGVGLMEVLVALVLLAIAVLGFTALQVRAVSASIDAGNTTQATNLAKDLLERIRVNREGYTAYAVTNTAQYDGVETVKKCDEVMCDAEEMAHYDFDNVLARAETLGMDISIGRCRVTAFNRKCIYVAWDETEPKSGNDAQQDCVTPMGVYHPGAKCIFIEAYNYE